MGKQTRAKFLVSMGAISLAALTGCAGGAPPNSLFQGNYNATYSLPALSENGYFSFSVEQKGRMVGSFTDVNANKVYAFDGTVQNNGAFSGDVRDGGAAYKISGVLVTSGGTGSGGDFKQTRNGVEYRGNFVIGGSLSQTVSQYQGIYSGVYNVPGLSLSGLDSFTVDSKGNITGSMTRGTETGLFTGVISNTGAFSGTVKFSDVTYPMSGTLVKTGDGSAQGSFTVVHNGTTYPASFNKSDAVKAGGDSPFKGSYRGTYSLPERTENGNVSFTVDPSGTILGFFSQSQNLPVATFTGAFQNDGTFSGTLTYPTGAAAPYNQPRAIVGKMGNRVGGSGVSGDFTMTIAGVNFAGNFEATTGASEPDSIYRAGYTDAGRFPLATDPSFSIAPVPGNVLTSSSISNFNVDKQGSAIGRFGLHDVDARITNDGRITGTLMGTNGVKYTFRGIFNKVNWKFGEDTIPGIHGNLYVTVNGVDYLATLKVTGGTGT